MARWESAKQKRDWCSICGQFFEYPSHQCPEKSLRGIDAAHRRTDIDAFDAGNALRRKPFWQRLKKGMRMIHCSEWSDPEE